MKFTTAQAIFAALAFTGCVKSAPAPSTPRSANIVKRDLPNFLDWKSDQPDAASQKEKIEKAFGDAIVLAMGIHLKEDPKWINIHDNYFRESEQANVEDVIAEIVGATKDKPDGDLAGSPIFSRINVINFKLDSKPDDCEDNDRLLAWLENIEGGEPNRAVMRICPKTFEYPLLDGTKCEDLDAEVSGKMSTLGGVILHELTHFDAIGKVATGIHITDYGDDGYGPQNTRAFNKDSNVPISNADSFRWFAQEYYWAKKCGKDFNPPTSNWDYIKCKEGEKNCIVM